MKKTIIDYLELNLKTPDRIAVDDGEFSFSYGELIEKARCAGSFFARRCNRQEAIVFFVEKSAITLAAMYGCVYAGCFYVMIDPYQPESRVKEIFGVLHPSLIICEEKKFTFMRALGYEGALHTRNEACGEGLDGKLLEARRAEASPSDLLYCLFTSGSTGVPKGILIEQQSVIDFIGHFVKTFSFDSNCIFGNQAPFDFDVSVKDIYSCMMTGARLVLIPKPYFSSPPMLLDYICEKHVTVLIWAVSALTLVSSLKGLSYRVPEQVKQILFSGEVMPAKQLAKWQKALPGTRFVNLYGPTEITCNCTYFIIEGEWDGSKKLPMGKAFEGREVFLLDEQGNRVLGANETGEICVAGESLAAEYYHNEMETKKRFCYTKENGETKRYYRTGDLGYHDEQGNLYFAGRKDFQIKHMGHRIELEEIEGAIQKMDGVERCCCFLNEKRGQLIAYYQGYAEVEEIRRSMKTMVPVYMIPHKFICLEELPLNKNGKIDRNHLKGLL